MNLPEYYELRKIIIRVPPTLVKYKDNRKSSKITTLPPIEEFGNWAGVYIVEKNGIIYYVGTTFKLRERMFAHRKMFNIDYTWFYEENDFPLQLKIEKYYKYKYFGRERIIDVKSIPFLNE